MLITNIIDGSFDLISQLQFYCQSFSRHIGVYQKQEIIGLVVEQRYDQLVNHIANLYQNDIWDHKQQVAKLLIEQCYLRTSRRQLLFKLIENKLIDIDVRLDSYGRTLLHMSAYYLDVELVKILTINNVGVRLRDYAGNTALHIAIQSYRNGALPPESGLMVKKNLSTIIRLLLDADRANLEHFLPKSSSSMSKDANNNLNDENLTEKSNSISDKLAYQVDRHEDILDPIIMPNSLKSRQDGVKIDPAQTDTNDSKDIPRIVPEAKVLSQNMSRLNTSGKVKMIMQPDYSVSLINTKNAFGRTALHYCALSISEKDLTHFIELLLDNGADPDATDAKMRTPFYCLMKRTDITDISHKLTSMHILLTNGCDDLGLALSNDEQLLKRFEWTKPTRISHDVSNSISEHHPHRNRNAIATHREHFKRTPDLKHLARLSITRNKTLLSRIPKNSLPLSLIIYLERQLIDQSDFM